MCARLLRDKGIYELIAAGRQLYSEGLTFRLVIAGSPDSSNPNSCSEAEIAEWKKEPWLDLPGFVRDTKKLLTNASIAVLPSYREGMPLFLLEAMAAGLPIVTTDVPGCRETVPDNQTGRLVKVKDRGSLAQALRELIKDSSLRKEMGKVSRRLAATHFSKDHVSAETLALYSDLLISDS
jgi:glycosyltransferase involved in cell wall biosynthesis